MRAYITGYCLLSVVQLSSVLTASTQCRRHRRHQSWSRQSLERLLTVSVNSMLTYHHSHRYCHGLCRCYYWFISPSLIGHYLGFFCSWVTFGSDQFSIMLQEKISSTDGSGSIYKLLPIQWLENTGLKTENANKTKSWFSHLLRWSAVEPSRLLQRLTRKPSFTEDCIHLLPILSFLHVKEQILRISSALLMSSTQSSINCM